MVTSSSIHLSEHLLQLTIVFQLLQPNQVWNHNSYKLMDCLSVASFISIFLHIQSLLLDLIRYYFHHHSQAVIRMPPFHQQSSVQLSCFVLKKNSLLFHQILPNLFSSNSSSLVTSVLAIGLTDSSDNWTASLVVSCFSVFNIPVLWQGNKPM